MGARDNSNAGDLERQRERRGIQQLDQEQQNEIPLVYQTAPDSITAVTNFLASAALCQSCEAIPAVKLMRSMDENQQAHAGSKTPTTPDECSMCQIFNKQGMTGGNRTEHAHPTPPLSKLPGRIRPGDKESKRMPAAPLRLMDVQANSLRIVRHLTKSHYVALSHRWEPHQKEAVDDFWGPPNAHQPKDGLPNPYPPDANLPNDEPSAPFPPDDEPPRELVLGQRLAKLADAVTVTRRARDARNAAEKETECSRMELIYSQAYCVVAVVWGDTLRGFLSPPAGWRTRRTQRHAPSLTRRGRGIFASGRKRKQRNGKGGFRPRRAAVRVEHARLDVLGARAGVPRHLLRREPRVLGVRRVDRQRDAGGIVPYPITRKSHDQTPYSDSQLHDPDPHVRLDVELIKTIYKDYSRRSLTRATDQPLAAAVVVPDEPEAVLSTTSTSATPKSSHPAKSEFEVQGARGDARDETAAAPDEAPGEEA
ncbi:hypothetical protein Hte_005341 [Hypoxylon texense]